MHTSVYMSIKTMWENRGVDHRGGLPVIHLSIACDILKRIWGGEETCGGSSSSSVKRK